MRRAYSRKYGKPKRLVFLDYNGTLLDDLLYNYHVTQQLFRHYGCVPPALPAWRDHTIATYPEFYWDHGIPRNVTGEEMNVVFQGILAEIDTAPPPFPEVVAFMRRCRAAGATLIVVSGYPDAPIRAFLEREELASLIAEVVGAIAHKTVTFQDFLRREGCPPDEALMIGDTVFDAQAAQQAGMASCICPRSGYHLPDRIDAARTSIPMMTVVPDLLAVLPYVRGRWR